MEEEDGLMASFIPVILFQLKKHILLKIGFE